MGEEREPLWTPLVITFVALVALSVSLFVAAIWATGPYYPMRLSATASVLLILAVVAAVGEGVRRDLS